MQHITDYPDCDFRLVQDFTGRVHDMDAPDSPGYKIMEFVKQDVDEEVADVVNSSKWVFFGEYTYDAFRDLILNCFFKSVYHRDMIDVKKYMVELMEKIIFRSGERLIVTYVMGKNVYLYTDLLPTDVIALSNGNVYTAEVIQDSQSEDDVEPEEIVVESEDESEDESEEDGWANLVAAAPTPFTPIAVRVRKNKRARRSNVNYAEPDSDDDDDTDDDDPIYEDEVHAIIGKKLKMSGEKTYRIWWSGFAKRDATWVPFKYLKNVKHLVDQYESTL